MATEPETFTITQLSEAAFYLARTMTHDGNPIQSFKKKNDSHVLLSEVVVVEVCKSRLVILRVG